MNIRGLIWKCAQSKKNCQKFDWLAEAFAIHWPTEKKLEMSGIPWLNVDDWILRFREIALLE